MTWDGCRRGLWWWGDHRKTPTERLLATWAWRRRHITALLTPSAGKQDHNGASRLPDPESIALILHTSGTTGLPKRAPRTHRALCVGARAAAERTGLIRTDVGLVATGFYNISGLGNMFNALLSGGCCVVAPAFDPARFSDWLDVHKPTWMFAAPTHLNLLLPAIAPEGMPQSALRLVRAGTQAMMPGTIERVEKSLGAIVLETYGMTEASALTASGPSAADRRAGSCGRILAVDVRILDGAGGDVPPGATGEIVVRGPTVFAGYLDDPEATAEAFLPGGWFRTGDVGYVDEDGYLFLTGRGKDQINRGGVQIAPLEVDRVLLEHPAVAEAAVFAIPDQRLGEDVVAAVVWRQGVTATSRELRSWLLDRLSPAKTPRRIWTLDALPRTATGKVQRGELTRLWLEARRMSGDLKLPDTVQTVRDALTFWAERTPAAPAFIVPGMGPVTYADLWQSVRGFAATLNAAGIGREDRVVLLLPEGPRLALAMLGTMSAAIALPLSAALSATELESALHGLDAAAAIVPPAVSAATRASLAQVGMPVLELHETTGSGALAITGETGRPAAPGAPPRPDDVAAISADLRHDRQAEARPPHAWPHPARRENPS